MFAQSFLKTLYPIPSSLSNWGTNYHTLSLLLPILSSQLCIFLPASSSLPCDHRQRPHLVYSMPISLNSIIIYLCIIIIMCCVFHVFLCYEIVWRFGFVCGFGTEWWNLLSLCMLFVFIWFCRNFVYCFYWSSLRNAKTITAMHIRLIWLHFVSLEWTDLSPLYKFIVELGVFGECLDSDFLYLD